MKCLRCGNDCNYNERQISGCCPKCHKEFAFEPRRAARFTDVAFQSAIDAVSAKGSVRWGVEHLYYELCRRLLRTAFGAGCLTPGLILLAIGIIGWMFDLPPLLLAGLPGGIGWIVGLVRRVGKRARKVTLGISGSDLLWARWQPFLEVAPFLTVIGIIGWIYGVSLLLLACIPGGIGVILGLVFRAKKPGRKMPLAISDFDLLWARWQQVHKVRPSVSGRKPRTASERAAEPDLEDYSFDRAVICNRARTVDLLLANNFHFENNCAVLAITGYPLGPFDVVRKMLKRNPRLHVFALHDASPDGCRLAHRLANDPEWFKDQAKVIDVGLRPGHATPFLGLLLPATGPVTAGNGITESEAAWLSSYILELAAIRPEQVLKRLFKAMNRKRKESDWGMGVDSGSGGGFGDGSGVELDSDSFGTDADASDGGADGFG